MNAFAKLALVGFIITTTSCTTHSTNPISDRSSATTAGSCTVSFELLYSNEPASNKSLVIYKPIDDRRVDITSKEYILGSGKTDETGKTRINFNCDSKARYVFMEEVNPQLTMSLLNRNNGELLSFECGGDKKTCDLGKINVNAFGPITH
ncbi:MAG: hypothetical protein M3539_12005 [Acidobacteriota bacterium]|nr:hypothetical protein [Acidobacteriota bacterium]